MKYGLEGIAPALVPKQFEQGECACCGMDKHTWKFSRKSIVSSACNGKTTKCKADQPMDVSSLAGAGWDKPKAQMSASIKVYEVDSNDEMLMD
jgi:hypothetical protein